MLTFVLTGRVGTVRALGDETLQISVLSDRDLDKQPEDCPTIFEWVTCLCRGADLCASWNGHVVRGDLIVVEGFIEPRHGEAGGQTNLDVILITTSFAPAEPLPWPPHPPSKAGSDQP